MELKGTRHLVFAWLPIIIAATALGGLGALAFHFLAIQFGLQLAYLEVFLGSLGGVLGLIYVLKKHHIPVRGLPD